MSYCSLPLIFSVKEKMNPLTLRFQNEDIELQVIAFNEPWWTETISFGITIFIIVSRMQITWSQLFKALMELSIW